MMHSVIRTSSARGDFLPKIPCVVRHLGKQITAGTSIDKRILNMEEQRSIILNAQQIAQMNDYKQIKIFNEAKLKELGKIATMKSSGLFRENLFRAQQIARMSISK